MAGDVNRFGWLTGLIVLVRLDLVVVALVVWLAHGALRRPEWLVATFSTVVRAAVVVGPWLTFSWLYFGTVLPDTLVLPSDQDLGNFADGLWELYHAAFPDAVQATLLVAVLGLLVMLLVVALGPMLPAGTDWSIVSAPLAGLAYFGALTLLGVAAVRLVLRGPGGRRRVGVRLGAGAAQLPDHRAARAVGCGAGRRAGGCGAGPGGVVGGVRRAAAPSDPAPVRRRRHERRVQADGAGPGRSRRPGCGDPHRRRRR